MLKKFAFSVALAVVVTPSLSFAYDAKKPFTVKSEVVSKGGGSGSLFSVGSKEWKVRKGQTLYGVLSDWGKGEGWDVVWDTEYNYIIRASGSVRGRNIDSAIKNLISSMGDISPKVFIKVYQANKVILVTSSSGI